MASVSDETYEALGEGEFTGSMADRLQGFLLAATALTPPASNSDMQLEQFGNVKFVRSSSEVTVV